MARFDLKNYKEPRLASDKKNVKIIKEFLKISCPIDKAPELLNKFFKHNQNTSLLKEIILKDIDKFKFLKKLSLKISDKGIFQ